MKRDATKYFKVAISTYLLGALFICRGAKNSYFFCRAVDDCADGDLSPSYFGYNTFEIMLNQLKAVIKGDSKGITRLDLLAIKCAQYNNGEIKDYLLSFLEAMEEEQKRRIEKRINTQQELLDIHKASFDPVLRIAFVAFKTNFSDQIINQLTLIQSKVYSIQDIQNDIDLGIYNFPKEIEPVFPVSFDELKKDEKFKDWVNNELTVAQKIGKELLNCNYPKKTRKVITTLVEPILNDIQQIMKT